jgi:hypothetical protein
MVLGPNLHFEPSVASAETSRRRSDPKHVDL